LPIISVSAPGPGSTDIEFMVQYGALVGAQDYRGLLRYTDNIRLLDELERAGELTTAQAQTLARAYREYRARVHRLTLQEQPAKLAPDAMTETREAVAAVWSELMKPNANNNAEESGA